MRLFLFFFFFSSRRRHTRFKCDWSSDVCSSDLCSSQGHGSIAPGDYRRGEGTQEAQIAKGSAGRSSNPAQRCWAKENGGQGFQSSGGSGSIGRSCEPRRAGITLALDVQEWAQLGGGAAALRTG